MKMTNQYQAKRKPGMTLLELTVVILVLLSLISILFVGARAWKKGSDRSANIMNLRNAQQAARGHENMYNLRVNDPLVEADIFTDAAGDGGYLKKPTPPVADITYTPGTVVTDIGTLWMTGGETGEYGFKDATEYGDW